jgi:hypothetical protein
VSSTRGEETWRLIHDKSYCGAALVVERLRLSKGGLTPEQKSAEGILGHAVGEASEALRCRKAESTDRPGRERWLKARTRGAASRT